MRITPDPSVVALSSVSLPNSPVVGSMVNAVAARMPPAFQRLARCAALTLSVCVGTAASGSPLPWFDDGRPSSQARQAVELLAAAASHGLEPHDYAAGLLQQAITQASQGAKPEPVTIARIEQALTLAMQRNLSDVHGGRIDPRPFQHSVSPPRQNDFDAVPLSA